MNEKEQKKMDFVTIATTPHAAIIATNRAAAQSQPYIFPSLCQNYYKKITLAQI